MAESRFWACSDAGSCRVMPGMEPCRDVEHRSRVVAMEEAIMATVANLTWRPTAVRLAQRIKESPSQDAAHRRSAPPLAQRPARLPAARSTIRRRGYLRWHKKLCPQFGHPSTFGVHEMQPATAPDAPSGHWEDDKLRVRLRRLHVQRLDMDAVCLPPFDVAALLHDTTPFRHRRPRR